MNNIRFMGLCFFPAEVQCEHPHSVKDGFIEVSNFRGKYVFGSLATYHCNPGYILWGNASRLCGTGGQWSGVTPQCKPITCGQPPEVLNARSTLVNGSTLWRSFASYECKPGFRMVLPPARQGGGGGETAAATMFNISSGTTKEGEAPKEGKKGLQVTSMCTESGIWQPVDMDCVFDPLAISLEDGAGSLLEGWKSLGGGDGPNAINASVIATIAVLATLVVLSLLLVVVFFTHKRMTRENCANRKVSQTSADQLIEEHQFHDVKCNTLGSHGGHGGGAGGKMVDSGMVFNTIDNRPSRARKGEEQGQGKDESGSFDTFPRNNSLYRQRQKQQQLEQQQQMSTFRPQASPHPSRTNLMLSPQPLVPTVVASSGSSATAASSAGKPSQHHRHSSSTESTSGCSSSVGQRSSGDGGSGSDLEMGAEHQHHSQSSPPYAKVKVMTSKGLIEVEEEDEEEESHYSLIRQPDGQEAARYR